MDAFDENTECSPLYSELDFETDVDLDQERFADLSTHLTFSACYMHVGLKLLSGLTVFKCLHMSTYFILLTCVP